MQAGLKRKFEATETNEGTPPGKHKFLERVDLTEFIELNKCQCLNQKEEHPFTNIFRTVVHPWQTPSQSESASNSAVNNVAAGEKEAVPDKETDPPPADATASSSPSSTVTTTTTTATPTTASDDKYLESNCDAQLLLYILFSQRVNLHALKLEAFKDGTAPKTVKLYVNQPNLSFDGLDDVKPTQVIELSATSIEEGEPVPLYYVKFQKIWSVTLFVEDNMGDSETTRIKRLTCVGDAFAKVFVDLTND